MLKLRVGLVKKTRSQIIKSQTTATFGFSKLITYFGESQHIQPFLGHIFIDLGLHYLRQSFMHFNFTNLHQVWQTQAICKNKYVLDRNLVQDGTVVSVQVFQYS